MRDLTTVIADAKRLLERFRMTAHERVELDAEAFYRDTGIIMPGKSVPLAMGHYDEKARVEAFEIWAKQLRQRHLDALAALVDACEQMQTERSEAVEIARSEGISIGRLSAEVLVAETRHKIQQCEAENARLVDACEQMQAENARLRAALAAARDVLAAFAKQAGYLSTQDAYSTRMTDGERKLAQAVGDLDDILRDAGEGK